VHGIVCREEAIYSTDGERQVPQLDEAMADTTLDILTDGPGAEPAPGAAAVRLQELVSVNTPMAARIKLQSASPSKSLTAVAAAAGAVVSPGFILQPASVAAGYALRSSSSSACIPSYEPLRSGHSRRCTVG